MKKLLLLLLCVPIITLSQQQIGQFIFDDNSTQMSEGIASNGDGSIMVVGYPISGSNSTQGQVKVFQLINSTWTQLGATLTGTNSGDLFGTSVSINNQGNIIAIGAPTGPPNGSNPSYTQVFINNNGNWTQLGSTILLHPNPGNPNWPTNGHYCGQSVALDNTGYRLAVSSPGVNQVRIFDWDSISWNPYIINHSTSGGIMLGDRIDLSGDGNTLAIVGKEDPNRFCKIYSYDGSNWGQKGLDISPVQPFVGSYDFGGVVYQIDTNYLYVVNIHDQTSCNRQLGIASPIVNQLTTNGYSDWQIPSQTELGVMCSQVGFIDVMASQNGGTAFFGTNDSYISSNTYCNGINGGAGPYCILYSMNGCYNEGYSGNCNSTAQHAIGFLRSIRIQPISQNNRQSVALSNNGNVLVIGDPLHGKGHVRIYDWDGSSWIQRGTRIHGQNDLDVFGHSVSISGNGNIVAIGGYGNDNNGSNAGYVEIYEWNENNWESDLTFEGQSIDESFGYYISMSKDAKKLSVISNFYGLNQTGFVSNYGLSFNVKGQVFDDADSNTVMGSGEYGLPQQILEIKNNSTLHYVTTNNDGNFFFDVDTGQYTVSYYPEPLYQESSNRTEYIIDVNTQDTILYNLNFGIFPEFTKGDMTLDLTTSNTVCNNTTTLWLTVRNEGTETITNVDLDLWVDQAYTIQSASGGGTISGNHVSWNLPGNFFPFVYTGEEQTFSVDVQIPGGPPNSSFINSARVTLLQSGLIELDSMNNFAQVSSTLLCSYDPNDKQVFPEKCFYTTQDTLDYTIRFQNTGNYHATTVRLVDSLDLEKLDIMSLHVLGASHDYEWSLKVPSVLEVVFDNIMLVDSSVSFNESQGFFKYRIIVRDSLTDLQPTASPAYIYFDLNAPIVTNLPEVNFASNFSVSMQSTDITCNGANDGTATLNIASATAPYTIAWNGGDTTSTLANLAVGTYSVTLTDDKTCVYTGSVSITEPAAITSSNPQTICDGQSITVGTNSYNTTGNYTDIISAVNGCDSTITTNLTVLPNVTSTANETACNSYNWNGQTYATSGSYTYTTTNASGCDSIATLDLTINPSATSTSTVTECYFYSWNGVTYLASGSYTYITTSSNGCDSTETLNLTINNSTTSTANTAACNNYNWNGQTYTTSGSYTYTTTNSSGCDSIATLNLTINPPTSNLTVKTTCDSYTWPVTSQTYTNSGTYSNVVTNPNGCVHADSLILLIRNSTTSTANTSACNSYNWNGQTYTTSGSYTYTTTNANGCDSTATLNLTITTSTTSTTNDATCNSYNWNGQTYNTSGNYSWIGTNAAGCDSIATLNLTINTPTTSTTNESSCDSYSWNGQIYTTGGNYSWTGANTNGCDSTAALNLTINTSSSLTNTISICYGESITVGSNTYNQTGAYTDLLTTVNGCDSTITTSLTIYSDVVSIISQTGNDITATTIGGTNPYIYEWNTGETTQVITPIANGVYWIIITDVNTCESDSAFFTVNWIPTSIEELNINKLSVYPNPSNDVFNILFDSNTKQDIDLRIHNIIGKEIFSEKLIAFCGDYKRTVDMKQYPNAIYILQLSTQEGILTKKLVLEK